MEPTGHARVSSTNPRAFARCDRCGFIYNLENLQFQFEWSGTRLFNTNLLVCDPCLDEPFEQLRTITLPPDPVAVEDARLEPFTTDEAGPVSSQISANASQGATTVYVASVTGFTVSQTVYVQLNNGTFATEVIQSIDTGANSLTVSIPLPYSASTTGIVSA
jgi:hypothetical protein